MDTHTKIGEHFSGTGPCNKCGDQSKVRTMQTLTAGASIGTHGAGGVSTPPGQEAVGKGNP